AGSDDGYDDRQQMLQRREEGDPGARPVVEAVDQVVRRFGGGVILGSAHGRPLEKERDFTGWGMERTVWRAPTGRSFAPGAALPQEQSRAAPCARCTLAANTGGGRWRRYEKRQCPP